MNKSIHFYSLLLFLLVAASGVFCNAGYAAEQEKNSSFSYFLSPKSEYIIGPGDSLEIQVWKEPDLSRTYSVRIDGRISVPLLGDIKVSGETIDSLQRILEKKFREVVAEPTVSVILNESRSWRYYVIGQIQQPGEFNIDYPISVVQAIAKCGGFLEWAKKDQIKVIRTGKQGKQVITIDFEAITKDNDLGQDVLLHPGDTILVP